VEPNHGLISGLRLDGASRGGAHWDGGSRRRQQTMIEMSFMLTSHPAAKPSISALSDLIYFPLADLYSSSLARSWLRAAPLIEYIVFQARRRQPKKALSRALILSGFCICCTPLKVSRARPLCSFVCCCLTILTLSVFIVYILFLQNFLVHFPSTVKGFC